VIEPGVQQALPRAAAPRIPLTRPSLPPLEEYVEQLRGVWERARLSNSGPCLERFEAACAEYGGWPDAVATANCDSALLLTVAALELPEGARVLLPSFTFGSTLHSLLWNRLEPRFVDVDPHTFCLDPAALAAELDEGAELVVATHAFGAACDLPALERLAEGAGAALVLDGAHAFATFVDGEHVGRRATATAFSFSPTKLVTSGEGGIVASTRLEFGERLRLLRGYGRDGSTEESVRVGLNAKLSELHAALGLLGVARVEAEVADRAGLASRYAERLAGLDGVALQGRRPGERPSHTFLAVDLGPHRSAVERRLAGSGIQTRRYFRPLHTMERFTGVQRGPLPVTERLGGSLLCLPLFAGLGIDGVDEVATEVRGAVEACE
jgi:dTDP-4-amino-4,6-dideoxygalactose transaminase